MNDIDFDELDRAVNSLNTAIPVGDNVPSSAAGIVATDGTGVPPSGSGPVSNTTIQTPAPPASLAGRRSTGQFMDVVHPSSNMRASASIPTRPVAVQPPIAVPNLVPGEPVSESSNDVVNTTQPRNDFPSPIDFSAVNNPATNDDSSSVTQSDSEDADINKLGEEIANTIGQTDDESLDSPFISGPKIEKRPLGAFSDESALPEVTPEIAKIPDEAVVADDVNQTAAMGVESLPAELDNNLLSIESGGSNDGTAITENNNVPDTAVETATVDTAPINTAVQKPVLDSQPAVATSITQQYQEQPSTGDQTTGAIYDTDAYHKAVISPTKKKSDWMWVLWIVLLLAVGAGAGAAVYYFILPNL